jgi:hypothetical protein
LRFAALALRACALLFVASLLAGAAARVGGFSVVFGVRRRGLASDRAVHAGGRSGVGAPGACGSAFLVARKHIRPFPRHQEVEVRKSCGSCTGS